MDYVRVQKLAAVRHPRSQPGEFSSYRNDAWQSTSLPVGYWLEGWLVLAPEVGGKVIMLREVRNGVSAIGVFTSTEVTLLHEDGFSTLNSVYRMTGLSSHGDTVYPAPLREFVEKLFARDSTVRPQISAGGAQAGNWWLDLVRDDGHRIAVEFRPTFGFGLSVVLGRGEAYGLGLQETCVDPLQAAHRVIALRESLGS